MIFETLNVKSSPWSGILINPHVTLAPFHQSHEPVQNGPNPRNGFPRSGQTMTPSKTCKLSTLHQASLKTDGLGPNRWIQGFRYCPLQEPGVHITKPIRAAKHPNLFQTSLREHSPTSRGQKSRSLVKGNCTGNQKWNSRVPNPPPNSGFVREPYQKTASTRH